MDLRSGQILPYRVASDRVTLADIASGRTPHQVILVMDSSGSMYGRNLEHAKHAALDFVERTLAKPNQRVGIVACPGGIRLRVRSRRS